MFTGLIEEIGEILCIETIGSDAQFELAAAGMVGELIEGESIAVDGVCLTVEKRTARGFRCFVSEETRLLTAFGRQAKTGDRVNLERALQMGDRLGGHLISGHVDGVGQLLSLEPRGEGWWLRIRAPKAIVQTSIPKGSIAIDGISLTLVDVSESELSATIIPKTFHDTTLGRKKPGDLLNLESDLIGKYVAQSMRVFLDGQREAGRSDNETLPASVMDLLSSKSQ